MGHPIAGAGQWLFDQCLYSVILCSYIGSVLYASRQKSAMGTSLMNEKIYLTAVVKEGC